MLSAVEAFLDFFSENSLVMSQKFLGKVVLRHAAQLGIQIFSFLFLDSGPRVHPPARSESFRNYANKLTRL